MKRITWMMGLLVWLFSATGALVPPLPAAEAPAVVVGRIFYLEGDLFRYVPDVNDWIAVVRDAPFTAEDTLSSGSGGMAELIIPNGTWIRIGGGTQIQFIALEADLAEMDMVSGMGRFFNKGAQTVVKVTSPFGYVLADPGSVFDFSVGESSVEVVAIKGTVSFVHLATDARYGVAAGSPSILADRSQVSSGEGTVDPDWDRWNDARENFWLTKSTVSGQSAEYLPPSLRYDAYALEENGQWERVPYEGAECWFWRPTTVAVGWSPFTVGRWTDWYGDETWIPAEPFGYATHHYGNWIYTRNHWYWAPPVASVRIGLPLLDVGFFWCPGRVSWIHRGSTIGWVPLAPRETYYCRRPWGGPHTMVVTGATAARITINPGSHAYVDHAVIVNRSNFTNRNDYRNVRVTNINRTAIINNYRAAPVVDNSVIRNFTTNRERYNYTNRPVQEKPRNTAVNRIRYNETVTREGGKEKASIVRERLKAIPEGKVNPEARIDRPRGAAAVVPVDTRQPKPGLNLPQGAPRPARSGEPAPRQPERATPARSAQPEQPHPERVAPAMPPNQPKPVQTEQPGPRPERILPVRPAQPVARPPERVMPARPAQPELQRPEPAAPARPPQQPKRVPTGQPGPRPEGVLPARPAQPEQPTARTPEHVAPARPVQQPNPIRPEQPAPRPERVLPARPAQPEQPAARPPERVMPATPVQTERPRPEPAAPARPAQQPKPVQTGQPAPRPERLLPARPAQPEQPAARPPERVMPAAPAQTERPRPEPAAPPRPAQQPRTVQPEQPTPKPERVSPAKPAQPEQPAEAPERVIPARPAKPDRARPNR